MASVTNTSVLTMCDAAVDAVDANASAATGLLRFYSGTVPTNVDTALSGNTLLATCAFAQPAFGDAADATPGGTATANAIADDTSADDTGTVTFARAVDRAATPNEVLQFTAGAGAEEIVFNSASITSGATVSVSALTVTMPEI